MSQCICQIIVFKSPKEVILLLLKIALPPIYFNSPKEVFIWAER
jgi:hypothetical protein